MASLSDLKTFLCYTLEEEVGSYIYWTEGQIEAAINQAFREVCEDTLAYSKIHVEAVETVKREYALFDGCIQLDEKNVFFNKKKITAANSTDFLLEASAGTPTKFFLEGDSIILDKIPSADSQTVTFDLNAGVPVELDDHSLDTNDGVIVGLYDDSTGLSVPFTSQVGTVVTVISFSNSLAYRASYYPGDLSAAGDTVKSSIENLVRSLSVSRAFLSETEARSTTKAKAWLGTYGQAKYAYYANRVSQTGTRFVMENS